MILFIDDNKFYFKTVGFVDLDQTFINDCKKKFNLVITSDNLNEFLESLTIQSTLI